MKNSLKFMKYLFLFGLVFGVINKSNSPDIKSYTGYSVSELNEMIFKREKEKNKQKTIAELKKSISDFYIPVDEGQISSLFRDYFRREHDGIDIGLVVNPKLRKVKRPNILAAEAGIVEFAGWGKKAGRMIKIKHANGFETLYEHLQKSFVEKGDSVLAQQIIGTMGRSGNARSSNKGSGIHLHFEIRKNNKFLDPAKYLKQYKALERDQIVSSMNYLPVVEIIGEHSKTKPKNLEKKLKKSKEEIYYAIQIAASLKPLPQREIERLEEIYNCEINCTVQKDKALVYKNGKEELYYKYSIGNSSDFEEVLDLKNSLESKVKENLGIVISKDNKIVDTRWKF